MLKINVSKKIILTFLLMVSLFVLSISPSLADELSIVNLNQQFQMSHNQPVNVQVDDLLQVQLTVASSHGDDADCENYTCSMSYVRISSIVDQYQMSGSPEVNYYPYVISLKDTKFYNGAPTFTANAIVTVKEQEVVHVSEPETQFLVNPQQLFEYKGFEYKFYGIGYYGDVYLQNPDGELINVSMTANQKTKQFTKYSSGYVSKILCEETFCLYLGGDGVKQYDDKKKSDKAAVFFFSNVEKPVVNNITPAINEQEQTNNNTKVPIIDETENQKLLLNTDVINEPVLEKTEITSNESINETPKDIEAPTIVVSENIIAKFWRSLKSFFS